LCHVCAQARVRRLGLCPGCQQVRSLPANRADGARLCAACAGITEDLRCRSCDSDDDFQILRGCRRCYLRARLERLFDNGAGHINPTLVPLVDALGAMEVPRGGLSWLSHGATQERIRAIATGQVALSHEGIDQLAASNGREHLRELLVVHHILPARDRYLAAFERWAANLLADIDDPHHRRIIAAYLRWHHQSRLERLAANGELTENSYSTARAQTNIAVRLLAWLGDHSTDLEHCSQSDIDTWFAHGPSTRNHARTFLRWAMRTGRRAALDLPPDRQATPHALPEPRRLELLARLLDDDSTELVDRVAGVLVLLYALPASRINRIRLTDLHPTDNGLALRLGPDPLFVPEPVAELIHQLVNTRRHCNGAGHPESDWLFPGRRAGQPIEPDQLAERLNRHGITRAARTAALNALLADVPAPVLAKLLDREPWRVATRSKTLATDWARYAGMRTKP
jgi:hypothetical protein